MLGADQIETLRNGYRLNVSPQPAGCPSLPQAHSGRESARDAGEALTAAENLAEGLALWRGEVLPEFSSNALFRVEIGPLEEERLIAFESRVDAELELGGEVS